MSKYNYEQGKLIININDTTSEPLTNDIYYNSDINTESENECVIQVVKDKQQNPIQRVAGKMRRFTNVKDYVKPPEGTRQDNMTKNDILENIKNYNSLTTYQEKKALLDPKYIKTWIKYFDKKINKFRHGGMLVKECFPDYIVLINPKLNISWSVSLDDSIIILVNKRVMNRRRKKVNKPPAQKMTITSTPNVKSQIKPKSVSHNKSQITRVTLHDASSTQDTQEVKIKDKLYDLYKQKRLSIVKK